MSEWLNTTGRLDYWIILSYFYMFELVLLHIWWHWSVYLQEVGTQGFSLFLVFVELFAKPLYFVWALLTDSSWLPGWIKTAFQFHSPSLAMELMGWKHVFCGSNISLSPISLAAALLPDTRASSVWFPWFSFSPPLRFSGDVLVIGRTA